jgi:hypothetical protein
MPGANGVNGAPALIISINPIKTHLVDQVEGHTVTVKV